MLCGAYGACAALFSLPRLRKAPAAMRDAVAAAGCSFCVGGLGLPIVYQGAALVAGLCAARAWRRSDGAAYALMAVSLFAIVFALLRTSTGFLHHSFTGAFTVRNEQGGSPQGGRLA